MLKRRRQSSKTTHEQIQRKFIENGIYKDGPSRNIPVMKPICIRYSIND